MKYIDIKKNIHKNQKNYECINNDTIMYNTDSSLRMISSSIHDDCSPLHNFFKQFSIDLTS
jgi:hypothetical protein